ncbi:MAG: DUF1552 domain-containing protein [Acidobacteria bacterium]|nr:DUF1552 domain-containing protein [Acidobacteriota bacterium]
MTRKALSRRTLLRGLGTAVALPFLDAMAPAFAASKVPGGRPLRMGFVYVPNGIDMENWTPKEVGALGELPRILKPLEPFKQEMTVLSNLTNNSGRAWQDGPGDHGRCCGSYLTGVHPRKSAVDIQAGVSCDQIVANEVGKQTRLPSIELGLEDARQAGNCDSGYSCAYTNNLAWRSETQPMPPTLNPRDLFERLFGKDAHLSSEAREQRSRFRKSVLDFVSEDTRSLMGDLGPTDQRKLDEYLTSIREIERQLQRAEAENQQIDPGMDKPYGVPADFAEHFKLMSDMLTVALQSDMSRVFTFLMTREGTSRPYREIGISDGHHPLTHHRNNPDWIAKVTQINTYHVQQFAGWIEKLASIQEGDGTLLDNSMIVYGAGLSDGNAHTHHDLPTLIMGRGAGTISPGRRVLYRRETPMTNLYVSMMDRMGVKVENFADSTGRLAGLDLS